MVDHLLEEVVKTPILCFVRSNYTDREVQLTIQGQTISSNFGTPDSSKYNLEQLISSGLSNRLYLGDNVGFSDSDRSTMNELAQLSYKAYQNFKGILNLFHIWKELVL